MVFLTRSKECLFIGILWTAEFNELLTLSCLLLLYVVLLLLYIIQLGYVALSSLLRFDPMLYLY